METVITDKARGNRDALYRLIDAELVSARRKFPEASKMFAVISEEVGECAQAMLTYDSGECSERYGIAKSDAYHNVVKEGVQAIAMIIRLLEEGDPAFSWNPPDWLIYRSGSATREDVLEPFPLPPVGARHDLSGI